MQPVRVLLFYLCLTFGLWLSAALAQPSPIPNTQHPAPLVQAVDAVGMTVADIDRSLEFYTKVLNFEPVSDTEVWGPEYEQLQGIFGLRMRVVRLRLGGEFIELSEYLTPK